MHTALTGEVLIASNAESIKGLISGDGGTTPHIRTFKLFALRDSSSLSLTTKDISALNFRGVCLTHVH